jgi:hypothetical protein
VVPSYTAVIVDPGRVAGATVDGAAEPDERTTHAPSDVVERDDTRRRQVSPSVWLRDHPVPFLTALVALPLVVALVVLHRTHWYPLLDMAETEMRVRDVASAHPPLIGLAGRIGPFGPNGGSHPGPLSFWALWPFYEVFGATAWALEAATVAINAIALGLALWIARRRGGVAGLLGVALLVALLGRAYGASLLTLAWNPYLPVLWWFVFLLAVWSVCCADFAMLPIAVVAGALCMQTHISYVGLVGGLTAFMVGAVVVSGVRHRDDARARRNLLRWGVVALAIEVLLWIPPIIDQIVHTPGNLSTIRDYFSNPPETPVGLHDGVQLLLTQLDLRRLLTGPVSTDAVHIAIVPGALLVGVWLVAAVASRRLHVRTLTALHVVIGVTLVLGVITAARIFGVVFYYLLLWARGVSALMLLGIGWTIAGFAARRLDRDSVARVARIGQAILVGAVVVTVVLFAVSASDVEVQTPRLNETVGKVVPPTAAALTRLERDGTRGPYLVTWLPDPLAIGSQGYGLLNELLRHGFDVRASSVFRPGATRYHIIDPARAKIEVHLATGPDIERWRHDTRYDEITYFDPRSPTERREFDRLRARVIGDLRRAHLSEQARSVDGNLMMLGLDAHVPDVDRARISRMVDIGMPAAVFIGAPTGG